MSIYDAFEALVPENIKQIPLMKESMSIFISNLIDNSPISADINRVFNYQSDLTVKNTSQQANMVLRQSLVNIYLESISNVIVAAQNNDSLKKAMSKRTENNSLLFTHTAEQILSESYFLNSKNFNQQVGTIQSINQAHSLASMLESSAYSKDITPVVKESSNFNLIIESSVSSEIYAAVVAPLAHPVGFTYYYTQILSDTLTDLYGIIQTYVVKDIEIRSTDGKFYVFSPLIGTAAVNNTNAVFSKRVNPLTNKLFTTADILSLVTVYDNKTVKDITSTQSDTGLANAVYFTDGTAIIEYPVGIAGVDMIYVDLKIWTAMGANATYTNTTVSKLNNSTLSLNTADQFGLIKSFGHLGPGIYNTLFLNYTTTKQYTYTDSLDTLIKFEVTLLNDITGLANGTNYVNSNNVIIPTTTSDCIIMSDINYVTDMVTYGPSANGGAYLVSAASNNYLTTSDPFGGYYVVTA